MRVWLQGGDEPVEADGEDAGADPTDAAVFADALPDEPGATNLGDGGQRKRRIERAMVTGTTVAREPGALLHAVSGAG
jgi:hypothetical protein